MRCVFHVIDRAVKSGIVHIDEMVSKLRLLLKLIRMIPRLRAKYAELKTELLFVAQQNAPGLDVATRWSYT